MNYTQVTTLEPPASKQASKGSEWTKAKEREPKKPKTTYTYSDDNDDDDDSGQLATFERNSLRGDQSVAIGGAVADDMEHGGIA